ncbi:MAG: GxxExxY protein [Candidatus Berkelbacteria bacterium]|nr:GxxExxY protein [Candidatus Berkelbacteria bacterium]
MTDLIFKDLSYKLTGIAYKVNDLVGHGQNEKVYADAFAILLEKENIDFSRELYFPIKVEEKVVKKYFFDFLIENKVIVELKANDANYKQVCSQIFRYLKTSEKKLGMIYRFTKTGVRTKRIPNLY